MRRQFGHGYEEVISLENLLAAWYQFRRGKRGKLDVQRFARHLIDNILQLHSELSNGTYRHGGYERFSISDPKPRDISKASVRDRLLHHALYSRLYPFFDSSFIADSFSCRVGKGTHKALDRFRSMALQVSKNNTKTCWVLKCDIRKFFANIDHGILLRILAKYIPDQNVIWLLKNVIASFETKPGVGLPLGNLTSQLFVNVFMNRFDQFVKHKLKSKYYIRYADDFVILSDRRSVLEAMIPEIESFLDLHLKLQLHPDKVFIRTFASGVDFLGWVHFPHHRTLRTTTKRRMMRRVQEHAVPGTLQSYLGLLRHGNMNIVSQQMLNLYWLWWQSDT